MVILWDFNGTIIDDMDLTVTINEPIMRKIGLKNVEGNDYRRLFRFPVREFYRDIGVERDEDYAEIARKWSREYERQCSTCRLQPGVPEVIRRFHEAGFRQVIISASQIDLLKRQLAFYPELDGMFEEVLGLGDVYAAGKIELGREYLKRSGLNPSEAVFLGDTTHDAETADAIGCRCILISAGHQDEAVLQKTGKTVLPSVTAAAELLLG